MFLHEGLDPLSHPLVALVDQLLPEVAVDLLRRDLLVRGQSDVVEVGDLQGKREEMGYHETEEYNSKWCADFPPPKHLIPSILARGELGALA